MDAFAGFAQSAWAWIGWLLLILFGVLPFLLRVAGIIVIPAQQRNQYAHAWLLLVFFFPIVGWLFYALLGSPKLNAHRRAQQKEMDEIVAERVKSIEENPAWAPLFAPPLDERHAGLIRLTHLMGGMPAFGGNRIELHSDYTGALRRIAEAIDAAQHFAHVQYFMFADDESGSLLVDALLRAQARGVKCRVLVDHLSNMAFNKQLTARLDAGGVEWKAMLPIRPLRGEWNRPDLRNHRKIVVIDNQLAFTGSQNAINNTYNQKSTIKKGIFYEEVVAEVHGPVVLQLQAVFATDWRAEAGAGYAVSAPALAAGPQAAGAMMAQVLPSGPGHDDENNLSLFIALLHHAKRQVVILTPYFVPNDALLSALKIAARRGVQVRMIVSGVTDQFLVSRAQWSYYDELLVAGVEIREVEAPVILHAKNMSIDDEIVVIGSSNMDQRSFELSLEVTTIWYSAEAVTRLRVIEADYIARSHPVQLEEWRQRPWHRRFAENSARLFAPLL